jgi:hypothetical protein
MLSTLREKVEQLEQRIQRLSQDPQLPPETSISNSPPPRTVTVTQALEVSCPTPASAQDAASVSPSHENPKSAPTLSAGENQYSGFIYYSRSEHHLLREENREPIPYALDGYSLPNRSVIMPLLSSFFDAVYPLYPIVCDDAMYEMASSVLGRGFRDDSSSCLILLLISLAKAYNPQCPDAGLADFQYASLLLSRLGTRFSLHFCQAHVLAALFTLKRGRILDFWSSLYHGLTMFYTMLYRYASSPSSSY